MVMKPDWFCFDNDSTAYNEIELASFNSVI